MNILATYGSKGGRLYGHAFSDRIGSHTSSVELQLAGESYDGNEGRPITYLKIFHHLIDTIKNGPLLFMYHPNSYWLNHSKFLTHA